MATTASTLTSTHADNPNMTMDSPQGIDGSYTPAYHDKVAAYVLPNE